MDAVVDEEGRPEPPDQGDELATTLGYLEFLRATIAWKCDGIDAAGMRATVGPSTMTLGGLLKHLAWVEDYWFSYRLHGNPPDDRWADVDWRADPDWEWTSAADDRPDELLALWSGVVQRSRHLVDEALASGGGLDQLAAGFPDDADRVPSLRWILQHMNEEYARHAGHADLLRESVDGSTGE
ncbi:MAG: DinB family protein [Actinomycetota bacterium]